LTSGWLVLKRAVEQRLQSGGHVASYPALQLRGPRRAAASAAAASRSSGTADGPGIAVRLEVRVGPHAVSEALSASQVADESHALGALERLLWSSPRLHTAERVRIAYEVWQAVSYLHSGAAEGAFSVLHMDVKAANVLLTDERGVRLSDFGLSRLHRGGGAGAAAGSVSASSTSRPARGGTAGFMDPRLLDAQKPRVGPPNDVWSFSRGVLQELFDARSPVTLPGAAGEATLTAEGAALRARLEAARASLCALASRGLESEWERRPDSAALLAELEAIYMSMKGSAPRLLIVSGG
jgi:serine/threonine protein kinase